MSTDITTALALEGGPVTTCIGSARPDKAEA